MAFQSRNLSVLAYANGFTLWHYATSDNATDVDTSGYFNPAADLVRVGDMIVANTGSGATSAGGLFLVASNASATVDLTNLTPVGATNTD